MTASPPSPPPRRWRLQYSLRFALTALTAFAIAFPLWYRWPYQEVIEQKSPAGAVTSKRVTTWQRRWGGLRWQHGPEIRIRRDYMELTTFVRGHAHGPFQVTFKG